MASFPCFWAVSDEVTSNRESEDRSCGAGFQFRGDASVATTAQRQARQPSHVHGCIGVGPDAPTILAEPAVVSFDRCMRLRIFLSWHHDGLPFTLGTLI